MYKRQAQGLDALFARPVLRSAMLDAGQGVRVIAGFDDRLREAVGR